MAFRQGGPDFGWGSLVSRMRVPRRIEEVSERGVDDLGQHSVVRGGCALLVDKDWLRDRSVRLQPVYIPDCFFFGGGNDQEAFPDFMWIKSPSDPDRVLQGGNRLQIETDPGSKKRKPSSKFYYWTTFLR